MTFDIMKRRDDDSLITAWKPRGCVTMPVKIIDETLHSYTGTKKWKNSS